MGNSEQFSFLISHYFVIILSGLCTCLLHQTLHKSASDIEKKEFLKEALLMNNFKHDHILRLLGVCLDHKPQLLILELMDGGDLLTFLRASRPSFVSMMLLLPALLAGVAAAAIITKVTACDT